MTAQNIAKNTLPAQAHLLSDARGIYIPRDFVQGFDLTRWQGITPEQVETLQDPDNEWYWDTWSTVCDNATFTENGYTWRLSQDGDLWAICYELLTNEEKKNLGMDFDEEENDEA